MDRTVRVDPDGPTGSPKYAIVGEAPASEEVRKGRGFVGPSGSILWPLLTRLAGIVRSQCYVTNLSKHPLDDNASVKLTPQEFVQCSEELYAELLAVEPGRILAVGALAAESLLGDQWTDMRTCNGVAFNTECGIVVPCWHPSAALRGDSETLSWTGAAIEKFPGAYPPVATPVPPILDDYCHALNYDMLGVDTEGLPDRPLCLTFSTPDARYYVPASAAKTVWNEYLKHATLVYHNAPWDWEVLEGMGIQEPWKQKYEDTMELAYARHTEPQALKDLAWRHLRISTPSWEQLVIPYWEETVKLMADGIISAGTEIITVSPKTGKPLKRAKVYRTERATTFHKRFNNTKWLGETLGIEPRLELLPLTRVVEYATLDAWLTLEIRGILKYGLRR